MNGKFLALLIVVAALVGGISMYYLQVYAYYEKLPQTGPEDVLITSVDQDVTTALSHTDFRGIDSDSSPIRYRACFTVTGDVAGMVSQYRTAPDAVPLVGPSWFDCFDAKEIGAALESGRAKAYLGIKNVKFGIDRVIAVLPDGQGFAWHQINECGTPAFDGDPMPAHCPPKPEGQ